MATLRRQRRQQTYQWLKQNGLTVVANSRSRQELESLFQIVINRYAQVTDQNPVNVYNQTVSVFERMMKSGDKGAHGRITIDLDMGMNDHVGSLYLSDKQPEQHHEVNDQAQPGYETRNNPHKPDVPNDSNKLD